MYVRVPLYVWPDFHPSFAPCICECIFNASMCMFVWLWEKFHSFGVVVVVLVGGYEGVVACFFSFSYFATLFLSLTS